MSVAQLAHADWLFNICWIVAVSAGAVTLSRWHARRRLERLIGDEMPLPPARQRVSDAALLVALIAVGTALLGPRIGERRVGVASSGVDVVVLIDVSRSMDARDNPPSRLDCARRAVAEVFDRLESSDRVALAAFAGRGVLLAPLTPDREALLEWVNALDSQLIAPSSTDLAAGVAAATEAFELGSERPRVIFLVSDGESSRRTAEVGVGAALEVEARVVALAVGSEIGAGVPDRGAPLRDAVGQLVVSRRQSESLARLSATSGGTLFEADEWGSIDFAAAVRTIRRDAGELPGQQVHRKVRAIRVAPFAALAFTLLLLEGLPRKPRRFGAPAATALLGLLALLAATPAETEEPFGDTTPPTTAEALESLLRHSPRDPILLLELGRSRLAAGQREGAARAFLAAALYARDPLTAARAHYSRGVAELERTELERARNAFFDALAFDPSDSRARFNLEWVLLSLSLRPPDAPLPTTRSERDEAEPDEHNEPEPTDERALPVPKEVREQPQQQRRASLDAAARARSLERVEDDIDRSLRAAARSESPGRRRSSGPSW
jgi:Ca-activated chloride channel family protein